MDLSSVTESTQDMIWERLPELTKRIGDEELQQGMQERDLQVVVDRLIDLSNATDQERQRAVEKGGFALDVVLAPVVLNFITSVIDQNR